MKIYSIALFLLNLSFLFAQNSTFVKIKNVGLYDIETIDNTPEINGFKELTIFSDEMDNTVWVSPETQCVNMQKETTQTFAGSAALHLTWDKVTGGCSWIGIGFGWNAWLSKDMSEVANEVAIQFQVKSAKGSFTNLPVAFAIEDYTGVQSYCGYTKALASGEFNETTWQTVTIPLKLFPFERNDADLSKVKQFMIQLEGDGDVYIDEIKIVKL
jgi:hypothetical protein